MRLIALCLLVALCSTGAWAQLEADEECARRHAVVSGALHCMVIGRDRGCTHAKRTPMLALSLARAPGCAPALPLCKAMDENAHEIGGESAA